MADEGVLHSQILSKLVEYTKSGGAVVVGGVLPFMAEGSQVDTLFSAFGLSWKTGASLSHDASNLRLDHDIAKRYPFLPQSIYLKAVKLRGVNRDAALYNPGFGVAPDQLEAPILQARVGAGILVIPTQRLNQHPSFSSCLIYQPSGIIPDTLKFVMVLSFPFVDLIEERYTGFFQKLEEKAEVLSGLSNARIIDLLSSPDLANSFIMGHKHRYLLSKLVRYSKNSTFL